MQKCEYCALFVLLGIVTDWGIRVRGGFGTLPTTAAFLGGLVAQEAIKLVTGQYNPLDNTVIVDLVKSGMEKFKF